MFIEMKKPVDVPKNLFCEGCSAKKYNEINEDFYCEVTGEILKRVADGSGKHIKTNTCFTEVRNHLIYRGK